MKVRIKSVPDAGLFVENNQFKMLSPDTIEINGKSHEDGGTKVAFNGTTIEAEKGETMSISPEGNAVVWGNMHVPGTNKKFKNVIKDIAVAEKKTVKKANKATDFVETKNPYEKYQSLGFNTGMVLQDAVAIQQSAIQEEKDNLASMQQFMLNLSDQTGKKPETISKIMKNGGTIKAKNGYQQYITSAAEKYGIDPALFSSLAGAESSFNPTAVSNKGAKGLVQLMPDTAKIYGITEKQLTSKDPKDIQAVADAGAKHFSKLLKQNNNDYQLALAAYNGGQGAVDFVKQKTGNSNITGEDWLSFMQERRYLNPSQKPSAWQNETFDYVRNIYGNRTPQNTVPLNEVQVTEQRPSPIPTIQLPNSEINGFRLPEVDREAEMIALSNQYPSAGINPSSYGVFGDNEVSQYAQVSSTPTGEPAPAQQRKKLPSLADRNKLQFTDFVPEIAALFDRPDFVQGQQYQPELYQPYQVSFQDRLNANNAAFRSTERQLANNPAALSILAGQRYAANNQVLAEQFRANQGIANDVINRNTELLNQANLTNIQLADQQAVRQAQAKANTDSGKRQALASISNKIAQNRAQNMEIRLGEKMFNSRINKEGSYEWMGPQANLFANPYAPNSGVKTKTVIDQYGNETTTLIADPTKEALDREKLRAAKKAGFKFGGIMKKMNKSKS